MSTSVIPLHAVDRLPHFETAPIEETIVLLKPDWEKEGASIALLENLAELLEAAGLEVIDFVTRTLNEATLTALYPDMSTKAFYPAFLAEMTTAPCLIFKVKGPNAIAGVTRIKGKKCNPDCGHTETCIIDGAPCFNIGTIRQMYSTYDARFHNVMHTPDTLEEANANIDLFFPGA
jgi:nucleoside diphosphate kinase